MPELRAFEARLAAAYEQWASGVPTTVDPVEVVRATWPSSKGGLSRLSRSRLLAAAALVGLVAVTVGAVLIGSQTSDPRQYEGVFEPLPAITGRLWGSESYGDTDTTHQAALLSDGRLLLIGLEDVDPNVVRLFDPETGAFTEPPVDLPVQGWPYRPIVVPLGDGRALVLTQLPESEPIRPAMTFDGASDTLSVTESTEISPMAAARIGDDRVLVLGESGFQIYDATTDRFGSVVALPEKADLRSATRLDDGRVLVANARTGSDPSAWVEVLDAESGTVSSVSTFADPQRDVQSAVQLRDGSVLFVGGGGKRGSGGIYCGPWDPPASAELFDPESGSLSEVGPMAMGRYAAATVLLADGRVLVSGGLTSPLRKCEDSHRMLEEAEIYDPDTRTFTPTGRMNVRRAGHTALRLADGSILVAGGGLYGSAAAELFR